MPQASGSNVRQSETYQKAQVRKTEDIRVDGKLRQARFSRPSWPKERKPVRVIGVSRAKEISNSQRLQTEIDWCRQIGETGEIEVEGMGE